jgi:hypothetical protein
MSQRKTEEIIEHVRVEMCGEKTLAAYRREGKDFTRQSPLTFERVGMMILRGHKMSIQNGLNKVFGGLGAVEEVVSAGAYCHARQKVKPELFAHLNTIVCGDYYKKYEEEGGVKRWRGHRLIGMDGSYLNLPDTAKTREQYSVQTNQHAASQQVQALAGVVYDLLNDLGLGIALSKRQAEKNLLMGELWEKTSEGDVIVMDRNFADYALIAFASAQRRHVAIRLQTKRFKECQDFWNSDQAEEIITLNAPASAMDFVREHQLPGSLSIRLIRVVLDTGETEVLMTTLLDGLAYPASEFKAVYGSRWNQETFFDRLKNIFDLERFSGTSLCAIHQDVQGVFFLASLESILIKDAQANLHQAALLSSTPSEPRVNRSVSYVALLDRIVPLLIGSLDTHDLLLELHHLFQTNPSHPRPNRQFPRPKLNHSKRLHFLRYQKRIIA